MKRLLIYIGILLLAAIVVVTVIVEREADYRLESLGGNGPRALILYHPSRDAHFSNQLSDALAEGLIQAGMSVERATLTDETPAHPEGYSLIVVVSNTYYWTPDLPTLRYLRRASLDGIPALGIIGGAGATGRSERLLGEALRKSGAELLLTQSYWIFRPNDETRMDEPNRQVAMDRARQLARESAEQVLSRGMHDRK